MGKRGRFISFEGGEGVGKSTQIKLLAEYLEKQGIPHMVTREPGGSPGAEEIRTLLVTGAPGRWDVVSETLLLFAARQDLLNTVIRPALSTGEWVLCDRFVDSSYVYQGDARGMPKEQLDRLTEMVVGETMPDLTFVMDIDPSVALARTQERGHAENRFEQFPLDWHKKLASAFRALAENNQDRCCLIDASAPKDAVAEAIRDRVQRQFLEK